MLSIVTPTYPCFPGRHHTTDILHRYGFPPRNPQAFIISGFHKKPKIVSGRATFTIPIVQRIDKLNLGLIQSNIVTSAPVPTADFIEVSVSAVVNFQVSADPEQLERATRNFLNFTKDDISKIASEVLEGSMREIIGQMFIKETVCRILMHCLRNPAKRSSRSTSAKRNSIKAPPMPTVSESKPPEPSTSVADAFDKPEDKMAADTLEQTFEKEMIEAQGDDTEKNRLANSITQAYARSKNLVYEPQTWAA